MKLLVGDQFECVVIDHVWAESGLPALVTIRCTEARWVGQVYQIVQTKPGDYPVGTKLVLTVKAREGNQLWCDHIPAAKPARKLLLSKPRRALRIED